MGPRAVAETGALSPSPAGPSDPFPDQAGGSAGPTSCVGFCFGGHLALLAATLPAIGATCAFYGARVSSFRPGGGPPPPAVGPWGWPRLHVRSPRRFFPSSIALWLERDARPVCGPGRCVP